MMTDWPPTNLSWRDSLAAQEQLAAQNRANFNAACISSLRVPFVIVPEGKSVIPITRKPLLLLEPPK